MATPERLRRGERELTVAAIAELTVLWRQVATEADARELLNELLPPLIRTYGQAAATLAADWYDEARAAAEVPGTFTALPVGLDDQGSNALAQWAASTGTDTASVLSLAAGGTQRRILSWSRQTVMSASLTDPAAEGWQRVASPTACGFCRMLADRGAVFSESSVDFGAHDHCSCGAVAAFKGRPRPVKPVRGYSPSERRLSPETRKKNNARARAWMRDNGY